VPASHQGGATQQEGVSRSKNERSIGEREEVSRHRIGDRIGLPHTKPPVSCFTDLTANLGHGLAGSDRLLDRFGGQGLPLPVHHLDETSRKARMV